MKATPRRVVALLVLAPPLVAGEAPPGDAVQSAREVSVNNTTYPPPPTPAARAAGFRRLLAGCPARELPDGWEFRFPGDDESVHRLVETVQHERGCSRRFRYELSFGRDDDGVLFRIRGGTAVKTTVARWIRPAAKATPWSGGPPVVEGSGVEAVPMPE